MKQEGGPHGQDAQATDYRSVLHILRQRYRRAAAQIEQDGLVRYCRHLFSDQSHSTTQHTHRHIPLSIQHDTQLLDERTGRPYISNSIRTSRYTIYDFVPKQIIFQATRLSNFYFIVIGIPQAIPGFSTTGNFTTILPLLFFMLLTILKEGYDDLRRHRLDKKENSSLATRYGIAGGQHSLWSRWRGHTSKRRNDNQWHTVQWRDLQVGDIIRVNRDEDFAADIILLQTDAEEGVAYTETMALDGETNLKPKQVPTALRHMQDVCNSQAISLSMEHPNRDLYTFDGRLTVEGVDHPLTSQQVIYRGSTLRNTKNIIGLVVNTGEECKIRMNANHHPKAKKPKLESYSNQIVMTLIVYVILLSVGCSIGYLLWQSSTENQSWYLNDAAVPFKQIIIGYGIMYNNVIPLAMYVSLEIVKLGQMLLVSSDIEMFDEANNAPMRCNTNTILENLGQVGFVLSDKTGTLTQNVMTFKAISVGGYAWSHGQYEQSASSHQAFDTASVEVYDVQRDSKKAASVAVSLIEGDEPGQHDDAIFHGSTTDLSRHIKQHSTAHLSRQAHDLVLAMAICNTCIPEHSADHVSWQASSPDEIALVKAANDLGIRLVKRSATSLVVLEDDKTLEYEILDIIDFSSARKRMSIVVRRPDGRLWLICKGADNMIIPRLQHADVAARKSRDIKRSIDIERQRQRKSMQLSMSRPSVAIERIRRSLEPTRGEHLRRSFDHVTREHLQETTRHSHDLPRRQYFHDAVVRHSLDPAGRHLPHRPMHTLKPVVQDEFGQCFNHIEQFAVAGLRTLMFANKHIQEDDYAVWKKLYQDASTSLQDRQAQMETIAESLEQSLQLLGATAIEDKLQDRVPETIEKLRRAKIRIWMLTGDKRETAINIAHSARICRPESNIFILDAAKGNVEAQVQAAYEEVVHGTDSVAVIDGHTLSVIESCERLQKLFFSMTPIISSVICCRASPAQKAFIVKAIHQYVPRTLTLAIGDGANDIAMIQSAHVGVGISGKEGMQAARVADYSIGQFSFLQRLLLVHGRWNYVRTSKFILWTFWKEMFFYMMQALYQQYTGYSGSSLYENWSLTALNTLFTSLCVILPGIFEQDLKAETLLAVPELYIYGQNNQGLNLVGYLMWMAGAAIEGMIVWYLSLKLYSSSVLSDGGAFALGNLAFTLAIVWTSWKLLIIETHTKTKIVIIGFVITVAGWWVWNVFLAGVYSSNISPFDVKGGLFHTFGRDANWWLTFLVVLTTLALLDLSVKAVRRLLIINGYWPLWKRRTESRAQERELEAWQELEQQCELDHSAIKAFES